MVKRAFCLLSVAWLAVALVGCGGSPEIKPQTSGGTMTPEAKKAMEEQMQKSMERSGYKGKPGAPDPTAPPASK